MKKCWLALLLLTLGPACVLAQSTDPDSARIVTEDIPRFWEAFDQAAPSFPAQPFDDLYLAPGTIGIEGFTPYRIQNAENLAAVIRKHPNYYTSVRPQTYRIPEMESAIRASFYAFKYLYPDAVFPDVYFVIGAMNSGGTTSDRALLIGAEMYGRTPDTPTDELSEWHKAVLKPIDAMVHTVAHELVHFQQKYPARTLLQQTIKEGSADFIAELISGRHTNAHIHAYADPREEELWLEFKERMNETDFTGWLYGGVEQTDRPADLGYWMGYKIARAYYERMPDKRRAIAGILQIKDVAAFLEASGYAETFSE